MCNMLSESYFLQLCSLLILVVCLDLVGVRLVHILQKKQNVCAQYFFSGKVVNL